MALPLANSESLDHATREALDALMVRLQAKTAGLRDDVDAAALTVNAPQITAIDYAFAVDGPRLVKVTVALKTVTLYTAVGNAGRMLFIDNASVGNVTLATAVAGQTINGAATIVLATNTGRIVYSDGTNWRVLSAS